MNSIFEIISSIIPFDDIEVAHRNDALSWIKSGAQLYRITKPDIPPKHLVSYFVVVDFIDKSILLVDHRNAKKWLPTGGHVELNENPATTVSRESKEELQLDAMFAKQFGENPFFITVSTTVGLNAGHTDVSLWYVLESSKNVEMKFDENEFNNIQWFGFDEIMETDPEKLDLHMHRFMNKFTSFAKQIR